MCENNNYSEESVFPSLTGSLRSLPFAIVVLHVQHTRMHLLFVSASYSISVITIAEENA